MARHPAFIPAGVIPAALLPFADDLSIDEMSFSAICAMSRRRTDLRPSR